jgi:hypothetical protein
VFKCIVSVTCELLIIILGKKISGEYLLSRAVASQISSARESLTSVFGMGTGVASPSVSPEWLEARVCAFKTA